MIRHMNGVPVALGVGVATGMEPIDREWFEAAAEFDEPSYVDAIMRATNNARADAMATRKAGF